MFDCPQGFKLLPNHCNVVVQDVGMQCVLNPLQPSLTGIGAKDISTCCIANAHSGYIATCQKRQLCPLQCFNVLQIRTNARNFVPSMPFVPWLKQNFNQRRLEDFTDNSFLEVTCAIDKVNWRSLGDERVAKHMTDALVFLAVQYLGHRQEQNLAHLLSSEFFQACKLKGLNRMTGTDWFFCNP